MNKIEKKLLNKVFNDYIYKYCYKDKKPNEFKSDVEHKIVSDICDFMKKYKI
tara:strand:+ start:451 stop:606 length:156 start_codon:yes stop_codon:yes gene_type:complete